mgnify:CR=1 FL=1
MLTKLSQRGFSSHLPKNYPKQLLINNKWVNSVKGDTFATINPCTEEEICQVSRAGPADIDLAVTAARNAFETGPWASSTPKDRAHLLFKIAELMERDSDELAHLDAADNGKPFPFAKWDGGFATDVMRYYGGWADKIHGK